MIATIIIVYLFHAADLQWLCTSVSFYFKSFPSTIKGTAISIGYPWTQILEGCRPVGGPISRAGSSRRRQSCWQAANSLSTSSPPVANSFESNEKLCARDCDLSTPSTDARTAKNYRHLQIQFDFIARAAINIIAWTVILFSLTKEYVTFAAI